jgi:hypothetical protein
MAVLEDNDRHESAPLLGSESDISPNPSSEMTSITSSSPNTKYFQIRLIAIAIFLIVLIEAGILLQIIPFNVVLEDIICRSFHPEVVGVLGEDRDFICKEKRVQSELALVKGWAITFECIPGMFALPELEIR